MAKKATQTRNTTSKTLKEGILRGDRVMLGKAITLIESNRSTDRLRAEALIDELLPFTGHSIRIGITGSPGVGKSTFIDVLGKYLISRQQKVAVLAVDPSSSKTKGSILGDKTRMEELSRDEQAFIRPTPAGLAIGGVADATRQAILLCEAAGYDVILVETVGVGQSEVAVRGMVDFFLLLMLAGAGDELQGIKKGIMEMADGIVITKADGENIVRTRQAQADFQHALHIFQTPESGWSPKVITSSAFTKSGFTETWDMIQAFREQTTTSGFYNRQRSQQKIEWFRQSLDTLLKQKLLRQSHRTLAAVEKKVLADQISPGQAARKFLNGLP